MDNEESKAEVDSATDECSDDDDDNSDSDTDVYSNNDENNDRADIDNEAIDSDEEESDSVEDDDESVDDDDNDGIVMSSSVNNAVENIDRCAICLADIANQQIGTPESCDHLFCLECIVEWAKNVNSCPVDRQIFHLIFVKRSPGGSIIRQIRVKDSELKLEDDWQEDNTVCEVCGRGDREDCLLLCDTCNLGYHMDCLDQPLSRVPRNEWSCPTCRAIGGGLVDDDTAPSTSRQRVSGGRRQIARTILSERITARVRSNRANRRVIDSSDESETDEVVARRLALQESITSAVIKAMNGTLSPIDFAKSKSSVVRRKKRKGKRKGKKKLRKNATTSDGKTRRRKRRKTKKRRRKGRRSKLKASGHVSTKMSVQGVTSPKTRIAEALRLAPPPTGRSIPLVKPRQPNMIRRSDLMDNFTLLGNKYALDDLSGCYDNGAMVSPDVNGVNGSGAERSRFGAGVRSSSCCDLLGSIMDQQSLLYARGEQLTIKKDGSLQFKPVLTRKSPPSNLKEQKPPSDNLKQESAKESVIDNAVSKGDKEVENLSQSTDLESQLKVRSQSVSDLTQNIVADHCDTVTELDEIVTVTSSAKDSGVTPVIDTLDCGRVIADSEVSQRDSRDSESRVNGSVKVLARKSSEMMCDDEEMDELVIKRPRSSALLTANKLPDDNGHDDSIEGSNEVGKGRDLTEDVTEYGGMTLIEDHTRNPLAGTKYEEKTLIGTQHDGSCIFDTKHDKCHAVGTKLDRNTVSGTKHESVCAAVPSSQMPTLEDLKAILNVCRATDNNSISNKNSIDAIAMVNGNKFDASGIAVPDFTGKRKRSTSVPPRDLSVPIPQRPSKPTENKHAGAKSIAGNRNWETAGNDFPGKRKGNESSEGKTGKIDLKAELSLIEGVVRLALKPYYTSGMVSKDEYKMIMRKAVPKILQSKHSGVDPAKIWDLVKAYVVKVKSGRKKSKECQQERSKR